MYIGLHAKYPVLSSDLIKLEFNGQISKWNTPPIACTAKV